MASLGGGALPVSAPHEGQIFSKVLLHFSDSTLSLHDALPIFTVQPGDGRTLRSATDPQAVQVLASDSGGWDVWLRYTYAEEQQGTFAVSVQENGGAHV